MAKREGGIHSGSGNDKGGMTGPSRSPLGAFPLAPDCYLRCRRVGSYGESFVSTMLTVSSVHSIPFFAGSAPFFSYLKVTLYFSPIIMINRVPSFKETYK